MAYLRPYRVAETTTTTGTGSITLAGAVTGYASFAAELANADTATIVIEAIDSAGRPTGDYEICDTTFTSPSTLSRGTLRDSSTGSRVSFAAGDKRVFAINPRDLVDLGSADLIGTLPVAKGGTGVTTSTGTTSVVLSNSPVLVTPTLGVASATSIANGLGAVGTPSYTFTGDLNTGMWSPGADTLAFSEGGVEAMRIDSAGNVGIGTTSPASRIHVAGTGGGPTLRLENQTASTGKTYDIISGDGGPLRFQDITAGAERMRIASDGNVGIGTSSPDANAKLDVAGTVRSGAGGSDPGTGAVFYLVGSGSFQTVIGGAAFAVNTGANNARTERMRIASDGTTTLNVGGVSSTHQFNYNESGGEIQLIDSTGAGPILLDNMSGLARLYKVGTGAMSIGTTGENYLQHVTNSAERMRITSGGDVGIGTSAPASLLHVKRGSNAIEVYPAGTWAARSINATDGSGENGLLVGNRWAGTGSTVFEVGSIFGGGSGSWYSYYKIDGTGQSIWSNGGTERMRLDTSGNVGIGTSSPGAKLAVAGSISASQTTGNYVGFGTGTFSFDGTTVADYGISYTQPIGGFNTVVSGFSSLKFTTAQTERMRIDSSGNVGIGTTSLSARFTVNGGSGTSQTRFEVSTTEVQEVATNAAQSAYANRLADAAQHIWKITGTERMRITAAGDVGIGTSSPLGRFTSERAAASAGWVIAGKSAGVANESGVYIDGSNNAELAARNGSGTLTVRIGSTGDSYINSSGNVGIGTSSPGAKLDVSSSTFNIVASRSTGGYAAFQRIAPAGQWTYDFYTINGVEAARITVTDTNIMAFATGSAAAERMRIDSSGNVGVGTSAPGYKLDVNGTGYFNSSVQFFPQDGFRFTSASAVSAMRFGSATTSEGTAEWAYSRSGGFAALSIGSTGSALTEIMRAQSNGNVGIGTASPGQRLEVAGSIAVTGGGNMFSNSTASTWGIAGGNAFNNGGSITFGGSTSSVIAGGIYFSTGTGAINTERMRIDSSGNVGIGLTNPGYPLSVQASSGSGAVRLVGRPADSISTLEFINSAQSSTQGYIQSNGDNLLFATSTSERARINSSGEFLVGTTSGGRTVCINAADNWIRQSNPSRSWLIGPSIGTSFNIWDETGGYNAFSIDTSANINARNSMFLGSGQNLDNKIEIGAGRTGSNYAYIDLIGDTTYTDFGLRMIRGNTGANTTSEINHRGTGDFILNTVDAAALRFQTSGSERMRIAAGGETNFNGLLVGRSSASTDVNTANDTGSFSVRGNGTTIASMSFHRTGAYAINMGLGTDNVFRIGGWSASSNCFQMDGSGNLAMLGSVTAATNFFAATGGVWFNAANTFTRGIAVAGSDMAHFTSGIERMRITSAGKVGIGTSSPDATAILDVSSTTAGFLPPRMSTAERDAIGGGAPPEGLILYNNTTDKLQVYSQGAWVNLH